jgi:hypothetical protein
MDCACPQTAVLLIDGLFLCGIFWRRAESEGFAKRRKPNNDEQSPRSSEEISTGPKREGEE